MSFRIVTEATIRHADEIPRSYGRFTAVFPIEFAEEHLPGSGASNPYRDTEYDARPVVVICQVRPDSKQQLSRISDSLFVGLRNGAIERVTHGMPGWYLLPDRVRDNVLEIRPVRPEELRETAAPPRVGLSHMVVGANGRLTVVRQPQYRCATALGGASWLRRTAVLPDGCIEMPPRMRRGIS